jgi:phenylacetate-coenzyme A ligase PaaK-like adenylate-forming protein
MVNPEFTAKQRLYITTGGSSGVPVGFYLHKGVSRPKEQAYLEAQWSRRGYRVGDRVAVIRGGVTSSKARGGISYYDATRNWLILSSYHLTPERLPEYVAALNRFRPQHLHAYPSAALMLARGLEQAGLKLDFPLTSLLCGSEKLTAESQQHLEQFFGARVCHWYGHSERVVLAAQGRTSNHLHFWPTYGFVEFGEANADGHREIIGTSFHNHVMPLIRYRTGDYCSPTFQSRDQDRIDSGEFELHGPPSKPSWAAITSSSSAPPVAASRSPRSTCTTASSTASWPCSSSRNAPARWNAAFNPVRSGKAAVRRTMRGWLAEETG